MTSLETIIPLDQQSRWLSDLNHTPLGRSIPDFGDYDPGKEKRFTKLQNRPDYDQIMEFTAEYVYRLVPFPFETHAEYWVCTCFSKAQVLVRINIGDQEVVAIHSDADGAFVNYTLNENFPAGVEQELRQLTRVEPHVWGMGRISILYDWEQAWSFIDDPEIASLIRYCNLSLMRAGKCVWARNHNYLLAKAIYDTILAQQSHLVDTTNEGANLDTADPWNITQGSHYEDMLLEEDFNAYHEGQAKLQVRQVRSRNRYLVKRAKERFKQRKGRLYCEICGFDFEEVYGEIGRDYIEAHHLHPIASYDGIEATRPDDVAVLCANCHRMVHRRNPPFTLDELKTEMNKHR